MLLLAAQGTAQESNSDEIMSDPTLLRETFLPDNLKRFAGNEIFLPLSRDSAVPPVDYIRSSVELLEIDSASRVFIIGRAVGFAAAYISRSADLVYTVELDPLQESLNLEIWKTLGLENIVPVRYPQFILQPDFQQFDAVLVHGIVRNIPPELANSLGQGGILLAPLSDSSEFQLTVKIERTDEGLMIESGTASFFPGSPLDLEMR
ncbi:MAG: hypothetical protein ACP5IA_07115 [Sediminispirochaetaceae bacterium]